MTFIAKNMNDTAIIICNYNGGKATVKCIEAVLKSQDIFCDIYVIDNASTDGSAEWIRKVFGQAVTIVQNLENLGGSGGFGRGLRMAVEKGYSYVMMLDNDAYVDKDTIKKMQEYLKENQDVGIVGAKIMMSDDPERIMDYAKIINFSTYIDESKWCRQLDSEEASIPRDCDFAAATAAMARREALVKSGGMDEAHFIYYDDIEMSYRIKLSGYRVVSLGGAKVWHDSGMRKKVSNTFARYYLTRNRQRFFAKYILESDIERFTEYVLSRAFSYLYGAYYKGRKDIFDTEKYILEDFIRDRRGKAGERRINELQTDGYRRIEEILLGLRRVCLCLSEGATERSVVKFCGELWEREPEAEVLFSTDCGMKKRAEEYLERMTVSNPENAIRVKLVENREQEEVDKVFHFCGHVKDMEKSVLPEICIDTHENMIASEQDYIYFRNYDKAYAFFKALYHDSVVEAIYKIRKEKIPCLA